MDFVDIKQEYGKDITFLGAIDVQKTLLYKSNLIITRLVLKA